MRAILYQLVGTGQKNSRRSDPRDRPSAGHIQQGDKLPLPGIGPPPDLRAVYQWRAV